VLGGLEDEDEEDEMNREAFGATSLAEAEQEYGGFFGGGDGGSSLMMSLEEIEASMGAGGGDADGGDYTSLEALESSILNGKITYTFC
jgi:hypothetical protein